MPRPSTGPSSTRPHARDEPALALTAEDMALLESLLRRHLPGVEAWAFGSRVTGGARPASDLDLVVFTDPEQAAGVADLREALEESDLAFRVDLHVWHELPASFRDNIRRTHWPLPGLRPEK